MAIEALTSKVGEWSDAHHGMWTVAAWELGWLVILMQRPEGKDTSHSLCGGFMLQEVLGQHRNRVTLAHFYPCSLAQKTEGDSPNH